MADKKVCVDSKILPVLHKKLKDDIQKKAKEKEWNEDETKDFINGLLKLYQETVELAIRENVVVDQEQTPTSSSKVKQEMEPLDKARAKEVNEMCAKSEDLLVSTIKKRKHYPQKIKESLRMKHDAEMKNLQNIEDKIRLEKTDDGSMDMQFNMTECEKSWPRLKLTCDDHIQLSESLADATEKFQRYNTVAKMKSKMQGNELHRTLFSKRKLPNSFDSILATPSKELKLDETLTDSDNKTLSAVWSSRQSERLRTLKGCVRKR